MAQVRIDTYYNSRDEATNDMVDKFIEQKIEWIDDGKFAEIYQELYLRYKDVYQECIGKFTEKMLEAGIDPLEYMNYVPNFYLLGSRNIKKLIIPTHINKTGDFLLLDSNVIQVCVPKNLVVNPQSWTGAKDTLQVYSAETAEYLGIFPSVKINK